MMQKSSCVPTEVIALLAVGSSVDQSGAWLAHISDCDACATALRDAMADLRRDPTPAEVALASSIAPPKSFGRRRPDLKGLLTIAAGIAVAAGFYSLYHSNSLEDKVPQLLARAYTSSRPFAWRLPDTGYAPVSVQRGGGMASESPELLEARVLVAKAATTNVTLGGWIELLHSTDPRKALVLLEEAGRQKPDDAEVLNLLGAAHAQLGDATQSDSEFAEALRLWTRALQVKPGQAAVQYNRALALMRLRRYAEAVSVWNDLIRESSEIDRWREEAIRQMERAKSSQAQ